MKALRIFWHQLQNYHSFRVYYRDGTRTRRLRWADAVGCAETFKGRIEFDPYDFKPADNTVTRTRPELGAKLYAASKGADHAGK